MMLLRQLASILALPFVVTVVVPRWILRGAQPMPLRPADIYSVAILAAGTASAILGIVLFVWSLAHFWTEGRGTLAPWDPPRRFVVSGPYRVVRNPMISGVLFVLLGEACLLGSIPLLEWTGFFAVLNAIYIPLLE